MVIRWFNTQPLHIRALTISPWGNRPSVPPIADLGCSGRALEIFRSWIPEFDPDSPQIEQIKAILLTTFRLGHDDVQELTWREIVAILDLKNRPQKTVGTSPKVILLNQEMASVNGKNKKLNSARYDLVEAMIKARPHGLTKDGIEKIRTDARGILARMRRDPDWESVIHMAKVTSGRYRID